MKRMLDSMNFHAARAQWDLPEPGSNRGYPPVQLIEQLLVSIWCGACRFTHLDVTRMDSTLTRLFGWTRVAVCRCPGHSRVALCGDGDPLSLADRGSVAQLSRACGLREPHQGIEERLWIGQLQPEQLLRPGRSLGLCHARLQFNERVSPSGNAHQDSTDTGDVTPTGAGDRRILASRPETESTATCGIKTTKSLVRWLVGQCHSSARVASSDEKWLMDYLGLT